MKSFFVTRLSRWLGGFAAVTAMAMVMTDGAWGQTNPTAQSLPYTQDFSGLASGSTTYPAGWQGWAISTAPSASFNTAGPTGDKALTVGTANSTGNAAYNYNGKIGYLNSGSADNTVALAINSTGFSGLTVAYDIMTIRNQQDATNTRVNEVTLQYRVGTSGAWTTLTGIEYQNLGGVANNQTTAVTTPQNQLSKSKALPAACDNQAVVQLRWASREVSGAGGRPSFAVDNLNVTGTPAAPAAPVATAATGITSSGFTANWGSVSGATSYRLDVATDAGFSSFVSGYNDLTVAGTSQAVTGLSASTNYFYRVRAVNGSGASGNSNTITATTAGSLASEPTVAASGLSFNSVASISMGLSWTNGDGATRIVVARAGSAVAGTPSDGSAYAASAVFGSGATIAANEYVVLNGSGNSVTVTGLTPSTTYHFAVFELNGSGGTENYLVTTPATGNQATPAETYTWSATGTAAWTTAANWTPTRTSPQPTDVLQFNAGGAVTATSVPTETVAQLLVSGGSTVNLQAGAASNVLTVSGGSGTDLSVSAGSQLNIDGANALKIAVGAGATGSISGSTTFSNAGHAIDAADASGLTFQNGSSLTQGTGATGNIFTNTGTASAVVFASGSTFNQQAGSNPFALGQPTSKVVFQTGSLFSLQFNTTPSMSGRTYANFELNASGATVSATGANALAVDNLTVTQGSLSLGMTGAFNLKGNVAVATGATLNFNAASAATVTLSGASVQTVSGTGTLTVGANENLSVTNPAGVQLQRSVTVPGDISVPGGSLTVSSGTLSVHDMTVSASGSLTVASGATLSPSHNLSVSGTYSGAGSQLTFTGTGAWSSSPAGQDFGSVSITAGTTTLSSSVLVSGNGSDGWVRSKA